MRSTLFHLPTFSCKPNGPYSQAYDQPGVSSPSKKETNGSPTEPTSEMAFMFFFLSIALTLPWIRPHSHISRLLQQPLVSILIKVARVTFLDTHMIMSLSDLNPFRMGSLLSLDQVQDH